MLPPVCVACVTIKLDNINFVHAFRQHVSTSGLEGMDRAFDCRSVGKEDLGRILAMTLLTAESEEQAESRFPL